VLKLGDRLGAEGAGRSASLMAIQIAGEDRIVHDLKISPQQGFEILGGQGLKIDLFVVETFFFDELREELLNLRQIFYLEDIHFFGRLGEHAFDRLIIEQQVNAVHTLCEQMFNLIQVRSADAEFFHSFMVSSKDGTGK
jgi:hypothetical protein